MILHKKGRILMTIEDLEKFSEVHKVSIPASKMEQSHNAYIVTPSQYDVNVTYPVIYLLHGYGESYTSWLKNCGELIQKADEHGLFIVMPEGGYSNWYLDSPVVRESQYATYIAHDVRRFVEENYPVAQERSLRAITGASMGGHGAFFLARRYAHLYGNVGATAGVLDLSASSQIRGIEKVLGVRINSYEEAWHYFSLNYNVVSLLEQNFNIIIDCGSEDHLITVNQTLHSLLNQLEIKHQFSSTPGKHDWKYFQKSILKHIDYFGDQFKQARISS